MQQFEIMHQNRMDLIESNKSLQVIVAVKQMEIDFLRNALVNSSNNTNNVMCLFKNQQITILKQQKMIQQLSTVIRRLRILNNRKKKILLCQKITAAKTQQVEIIKVDE